MHIVSFFAQSQFDQTVEKSKEVLERLGDTFFNTRSIITFIIAITIAIIAGRIIAGILRRFARVLSRRADKEQDLKEVNRLRRYETLTILISALIRMALVVIGVYFWWVLAFPSQQPSALIGASALAVLITSATIGPVLRDLAYGAVMMAEHWYGVGDHVKVEPFNDLQGIVERVTLRSTKIRGLNGEVIWINNQNIQGIRITPKGVRTIAIEIFVSDLTRGLKLIEDTNLRLPISQLMVVRPLHIMAKSEVAPNLWHITAIGETAPSREWLLEDYAKRIMIEHDEESKHPCLENDPIVRYADSDAEHRFARTIQNATKSSLERKHLPLPEAIVKQLQPTTSELVKKVRGKGRKSTKQK